MDPDQIETDSTIDSSIETAAFTPGMRKDKLKSEIKIAERKMKLEELRVTHQIDMENRVADAKAAETARANRIEDSLKSEHWLKSYWRPAAGWTYLLICITDFIAFPVFSMLLPIFAKAFSISIAYTIWQPITLSGGGLVHISFGAILGVTAWTRGTAEKTAPGKTA